MLGHFHADKTELHVRLDQVEVRFGFGIKTKGSLDLYHF